MQPRTLRILLAVSVLLNLFLLGVAIGGGFWLNRRLPTIAAGSFRVAGAELPVDERRAFRAALRDTRRQSAALTQASREARSDAAGLLAQPQVDQAAVAEALGRARAADFALRVKLEQRAIAFAATLPPADRARLSEGLVRRPGRRMRPVAE